MRDSRHATPAPPKISLARSLSKTAIGLASGFALILAAGCATSTEINRDHLLGAWTSHGGEFDMVFEEETILFEFDMREHPYRLDGNVLTIDFQDPTLGVQRKEILRLTPDLLELRDLQWDETQVYRRVE